jgi:hypothetical protein
LPQAKLNAKLNAQESVKGWGMQGARQLLEA